MLNILLDIFIRYGGIQMVKKIKKSFQGFKPYIQGHQNMFKCAVLIPLVEKDGKTHILFEVRSKDLSVQPSEISFPGGGLEPEDNDFLDTAVRETCEELGLSREDIDVISPLNVFITPFNLIIHPFVGTVNYDNIDINRDEVDHVFLVPLDFFIKNNPNMYSAGLDINIPDDFPYHLIPNGKNYKFRKASYDLYFYNYKDYIIWGITAKILKDFLDDFKERYV